MSELVKAGESNGGSAWESNPASPREQGATDFEDREGHRTPFASESIVARDGVEHGIRIAEILEHDVRSGRAQFRHRMTPGRHRNRARA
jgi:hypothetical protein